jgi:hypothetical protein
MVSAVARQLLRDRGAERLVLLDDGTPEAALAARLLEPLGEAVVRLPQDGPWLDSVLHVAGHGEPGAGEREEAHRFLARLVPGSLSCGARSKTDLVLGGELPPEPFLPLGDLYASEIVELGGGWRGTELARELATAAGGVERLDQALRALLDARDHTALERLPAGAGERVAAALATGSSARAYPRLVPKLGTRTLGVDLFE